MIERIFWGWDKPVIELAVEVLTRDWQGGEFDLSDTLIVVPTSETARRLKEALARAAAKHDSAVSAPHVWAPERALLTSEDRSIAASETQLMLAWTRTLLHADLSKLTNLFPIEPSERSWTWAVEMANALIDVSTALGAGGHSFADVANMEDLPRDRERWADLAVLETSCANVLSKLGVRNMQSLKKARAASPQLPEGVKRILVMPSPDLPQLFRRWLDEASKLVPVTMHIHAPKSLAAHFDEHGAPLKSHWGEKSSVTVPLRNEQIHLEHDPSEQARRIIDLLREQVPQRRTALGVCDAEVTTHLEDLLQQEDVRIYEPGGVPSERHGTVQMLGLWADLVASDDWGTFAALLRVPDVRDVLSGSFGPFGTRVLEAADEFAAQHLPVTLGHAVELIDHYIASKGEHAAAAQKLGLAMRTACDLIDNFDKLALHEAARALLMKLFGEREYQADAPQHRDHVSLCTDWLQRCEELYTQATALALKAGNKSLLSLSIQWLKQQRLSDPRGEIDLVLLGWLELLWEPSPALLISGFNEESVPGILISHPFLPDQLREALNLASQASRFARDAYLLSALAEQRRDGALHITCGLWSEGKDALRPSRLLFLCDDAQLVHRVRHLFPKDFETTLPKEPARQRAWKLKPRKEPREPLTTISNSRLKSYLACPFRYYLDNVLHMSSVDAAPAELDAMAYGNLIHGALQILQTEDGKRCGTDEAALADLLCARVEAIAHSQHGKRLPVPVQLQLDGAKQRLRAAAKQEAELRAAGWRTEESEFDIGKDEAEPALVINGARFRGRVDRIDSNSGGLCRIIDYKTSDKPDSPLKTHLKEIKNPDNVDETEQWKLFIHSATGTTYRWLDLQLPLYAKAWSLRTKAAISTAYFNLPKAIEHTKLDPFDELDEEMIEAAVKVAEEAVSRINAGIFWPPAGPLRPEDYPGLIHGDVEQAVEWA